MNEVRFSDSNQMVRSSAMSEWRHPAEEEPLSWVRVSGAVKREKPRSLKVVDGVDEPPDVLRNALGTSVPPVDLPSSLGHLHDMGRRYETMHNSVTAMVQICHNINKTPEINDAQTYHKGIDIHYGIAFFCHFAYMHKHFTKLYIMKWFVLIFFSSIRLECPSRNVICAVIRLSWLSSLVSGAGIS